MDVVETIVRLPRLIGFTPKKACDKPVFKPEPFSPFKLSPLAFSVCLC